MILDDIAKGLSSVLSIVARMVGLRAVEPVQEIVTTHFFPMPNTLERREVGPNRCYWCLHFDAAHEEITDPPCRRKRPGGVELA